jgi:rhodanese-related sulfurtransferase
MSSETSSTIGEQRRTNYALQPMSREQFVEVVTADLPEVPPYFPMDVALNRSGAPALAERRPLPALAPEEVEAATSGGAVLLDVRSAAEFGAGHPPGAVNVGLAGQFASWAGTLVDAARPLVIVAADEDRAHEAAVRLARVGLDNVAGFLSGGALAWERSGRALARLPQIAVGELWARLGAQEDLRVLDVRRPAEYSAGHVPGARPAPLDRLQRELGRLDATRPTAVICAGGYRSSTACSLLRRSGFAAPLFNVVGGTSAWVAAGYATERAPA